MTAPSDAVMSSSYDPLQIGLSILIGLAASYAALDVAGRVMAKREVLRAAWLAGGTFRWGVTSGQCISSECLLSICPCLCSATSPR